MAQHDRQGNRQLAMVEMHVRAARAGTDADSIVRGALNSLSTTAAACDWVSITILGPLLARGQPRLIVVGTLL
jgi:hypothetical protein